MAKKIIHIGIMIHDDGKMINNIGECIIHLVFVIFTDNPFKFSIMTRNIRDVLFISQNAGENA